MTTTGTSRQSVTASRDQLKWLAVAVVWVLGLVGSFFLHAYTTELTAWYQATLWIAVILLSAGGVYTTALGAQLAQFFKDSKIELRKVVWPERQETLQATLMVLVAVLVMSLLLWLIDSLLFYIIGYVGNIR